MFFKDEATDRLETDFQQSGYLNMKLDTVSVGLSSVQQT